MILWTAILVFAVTVLLTRSFVNPGSQLHILDYPNERSLHSRPVPRTGGVAIVTAILAGGLLYLLVSAHAIPRELGWLAGLATVIACVSYLDDRRHMPVSYRLTAHVVAAVLLAAGGLAISSLTLPGFTYALPGWLAVGLTVLFTVWMVNLYNFMDGMDGFAGGMAVFGFGALAMMGWMTGHDLFLAINLIIASASAGFLVFNFPPAKIFMGDVGSSTLGMLAAALSLWGAKDGVFPLWLAVLVFSPFITDATVTLLRRLWRREKIWRAHKTHYYQQLVQAGWGHRKTVLLEYLIMLGCGLTAVFGQHATTAIQAAMLAGWVLFYIIFFSWVSWYVPRRHRDSA
jgi:UDP-N-acetylmuramyl pentapeptide phosphotransferase/UDP-N-acetylglucosamine-1-phosphate transferase